MIVLIDNYDSFAWNLWHFLTDLGAEVEMHRNDALTVEGVLAQNPSAIVLSPGPCTPFEAGICIELVQAAAEKSVPMLGVCLGFQAIGVAFGAALEVIAPPVHGKLSFINHRGRGVMADCPNPVAVARYHSLGLRRASLPECLAVTAETGSGLVMALEHKTLPIHAVLFHPESIASVAGYRVLANFLQLAGINSLEGARIEQLESQTLNLHTRFPEHIHE